MSIAHHEYLSQLPRGNGEKLAVFEPSSQSYRPYLRDPHTPEYLEDWLYSDSPQLAIHVVSFDDVTILTVTMPHTLSDAMGLGAFMDAWTKILNGQQDQVPRLVGFGGGADDPLKCLYNGKPKSSYVMADRLVSGWSRIMYIARTIFELLWYRETETRLTMVLGKFLNNLRESLRQQLKDAKGHDETLAKKDHQAEAALPFLSESDVLFTWWTRIVVRAQSPSPQRTVSLLKLADTRSVLSKMSPLLPAGSAVMANAMFPMTSLIPAREFVSKSTPTPLSTLSNYVREAINIQRTEDQLLAHAAAIKESFNKYGHSPVYGESDVHRVVCTNWHRGGFFHLDFSGAIVEDSRTGVKDGSDTRGKPKLITSTWVDRSFLLRNFIVIVGKDALGNWWLMTRVRPKDWKGIEQQLEQLCSKP
jgi:hypothetical protein